MPVSTLPAAPWPPDIDDPVHWRGATALLDLEDPRLRVRARSLTQLCKSEREKALAVYAFVKRLPFGKPVKLQARTARQVLDAGRGDSPDKATLFVALLRLAGIAARIHWWEMKGEVVRGLVPALASGGRPMVEAWLGGTWVSTDTYIFDAAYMAAARQRLKELGWECGFGIHREGQGIWNGVGGAWVTGRAPTQDPLVLEDLGCSNDPAEFIASDAYRRKHRRLARALRWNVMAPGMERAIRELRGEDGTVPPSARSKTSP